MKTIWMAGSAVAIALATSLAMPAMAQDTATPAMADTSTGGDIVVTARKREETIQSIPAAVAAVTQDALVKAGAQSLDDVVRMTPGVTFNSGNAGGLAAPAMRGITNITSTTFDNNVGVFLDGVYLSAKSNLDIDLFNLARVEVIKGPQSALYGNNAFAGAINYVLDRPADHLSGRIKASVGTDNMYEVAGKISVPITNSLRIMGVGTYSHFGGTIKNVQGSNLGGWDYKVSGSGMVDFDPGTGFTANLFYYHYQDKMDGGANYMFTNDCGGTISPVVLPNRGGSDRRFACGTLEAPDAVNVDPGSYSKRKTNLVIGRMGYDFGPVALRYTGSYAKYDTFALQDQHLNSYGGTLTTAQRRFTQPYVGPVREASSELRLESYGNKVFDWALGGYYYDRKANQSVKVGYGYDQVTPSLDLVNIENTTMKSVFGLTNVKITPTLSIEAQGRWTWEDKDGTYTNRLTGAVLAPEQDFSYGTYRVTGNWEWNPDRMLYAVVASGTKSGGFNNTSVVSEQSYGPEKNTSFEIGSKNTFLGGRVIINVAAYYIDWTDVQIAVPSSVIGQTNPVTNIGSASVKGFEFSTALRPTPDWDVSFGYNYANSKWDKGTVDYSSSRICPTAAVCGLTQVGTGIDVGGFMIPRISAHQISAASTYTIPLATSEIYLHADMSYRSEQATNAIALQKVPEQTFVNGRIGWKKDGYELAIFAKNLFNERYVMSSVNEPEFYPSTSFTTGFIGNGRVIGASLEAAF
ncbi:MULTISPECIES: TonB-dependent siderophore receptor [unclassified Novosphingobium]|uniref:TonB-dependent receptor n=1 Tax=unclassified Novosphingobium TaxID=2644732 RepID=UPI001357F2FE|nr:MULTISPECIES: TonB-dependent receptor [unclassified Novosphingobium]